MAIILDANVIIRGEKGTLDLKKWVASRPNDQFEVAVITVAELWHGVERASRSRKTARRQYLRTVLDLIPIIPYTRRMKWTKNSSARTSIRFISTTGWSPTITAGFYPTTIYKG